MRFWWNTLKYKRIKKCKKNKKMQKNAEGSVVHIELTHVHTRSEITFYANLCLTFQELRQLFHTWSVKTWSFIQKMEGFLRQLFHARSVDTWPLIQECWWCSVIVIVNCYKTVGSHTYCFLFHCLMNWMQLNNIYKLVCRYYFYLNLKNISD